MQHFSPVSAKTETAQLRSCQKRLVSHIQQSPTHYSKVCKPVPLLSSLFLLILPAYTEGFEAGSNTTQPKYRPQQLTTSQRRSRSMHEFSPQNRSPHDMNLSNLALDPLSAHHNSALQHHQHQQHHYHANSSNSHSPLSFGMKHHHLPVSAANVASLLGASDFGLPLQDASGSLVDTGHGVHHRPTPVRHRSQQSMQNGMAGSGQPPPRSVPHGLSLSIPRNTGGNWGAIVF
jgi:hypothetical protein